jgi:hypothetical protein
MVAGAQGSLLLHCASRNSTSIAPVCWLLASRLQLKARTKCARQRCQPWNCEARRAGTCCATIRCTMLDANAATCCGNHVPARKASVILAGQCKPRQLAVEIQHTGRSPRCTETLWVLEQPRDPHPIPGQGLAPMPRQTATCALRWMLGAPSEQPALLALAAGHKSWPHTVCTRDSTARNTCITGAGGLRYHPAVATSNSVGLQRAANSNARL